MIRVMDPLGVSVIAAIMAMGFSPASGLTSPGQQTAKPKLFAQKLVEKIQAKHPEADEIGISVRLSGGCKTIASTDRTDIGEACEKDDIEPMRTGMPFVEKERDGYDISVALHDAKGKLVGSVGIGFKPAAGQTEKSFVEKAKEIAREMEAQISSRAQLFARSQ